MAPPRWWSFLALFLVIGILSKIYPLVAFVIMLGVISMFALWWQRHALDGITYIRKPYYRRGFPGEKIEVRLEVENRKLLPAPWIRVRDSLPLAISPSEQDSIVLTHIPEQGLLETLYSLRWYERDRRCFKLLLRQRGVFPIGPYQLDSGDLFGIFEQTVQQEKIDYLTVFPLPAPLKELGLPAEDPFGDIRSRRRLFEDPNRPMGVRQYHPEDDFRRVHWLATAHTGELQVKIYQPISAQVLMVCLNVSTLPHTWEGTWPELLEHLLSVATTIVEKGLTSGYQVGLVSNGCLAHADQPFRVPPGRSPNQLAHLLTVLASVTPIVTAPFDRFLMAESPRLPFGASLVVITGLVTPLLSEILWKLKQHGRRITMLSFARESPEPIPGINIIHQPFYG